MTEGEPRTEQTSERFVVRRTHKLVGSSYVVGVRDRIHDAIDLARAEFKAGEGLVCVTVEQYPSPQPLIEFK